eukprot:365091-Chlamydomonas_euryale.AAC.1
MARPIGRRRDQSTLTAARWENGGGSRGGGGSDRRQAREGGREGGGRGGGICAASCSFATELGRQALRPAAASPSAGPLALGTACEGARREQINGAGAVLFVGWRGRVYDGRGGCLLALILCLARLLGMQPCLRPIGLRSPALRRSATARAARPNSTVLHPPRMPRAAAAAATEAAALARRPPAGSWSAAGWHSWRARSPWRCSTWRRVRGWMRRIATRAAAARPRRVASRR